MWAALLWIICALPSGRAVAQTARTTANQGTAAHYGWQDPDGFGDGLNSMSLNAIADTTVAAASRLYNTVGDPTAGINLPAYNGNYTLTFKLTASTTGLPPGHNSTITAYLTTEYSTNNGGSWTSVGGTSQVVASRSTPGITTTVQAFTPTLNFSSGLSVWIRLILRGTATGTIGGGSVKVQIYANTGWSTDPYAVTWSNIPGSPLVDASSYNFDNQDYRRCAQACFAAVYSQATVPYYSLDAARSVTLAYNGDRVSPRPFVAVTVKPDPAYGTTPYKYQLQVKVNGAFITFLNGEQTLNFDTVGTSPARIGGQFNASSYATGVYPLDILVTAVYPTTSLTSVLITKLAVVNETTNPVARGWSVAGVQRLYSQADGSALITDGSGSSVYFQKIGSVFAPPVGEFSTLVTGTPSGGSGWTRRFPDSTKVVFNATGKMTELRDRFVNTTTITYDGSNRIWKVTDPQNLVITLVYNSNGLSTITDAGNPARVTTVTVDASKRLTAIRDPDNVSTTFGYDSNQRLSTITNRNGKTTTIGYSANDSTVTTLTGPSVTFFDGTTGSPVITFAAWQKRGVPYVLTATTPFTPPQADTVYARVTEPGGAETRFTVSRWGTPVQITDGLGGVTTTTFDANGLPLRTVYPTGAVDSAVYNSSGLPTFIQSADSTNRRTFRYAGWAQVDSAWGGPQPATRAFIGVNGRVDWVRVGGTPTNSSKTSFAYDALGRVVSDTDPEHHLLRKRWYAGANGNLSKDSVPGGGRTTYLYDAFGRDTSSDGPLTPMRRIRYDALNRRTQFYDGVNATPTVTAYDLVGNVVSVTDPQNQVYQFAYNALGWLITRTDPVNKSDTLKYSRDGDLMRRVNRRNQTISFAYDALHRNTSKTGTNTDANTWGYSTNGRVITAIDPITTETAYLNVRGQPDSLKTVTAAQTFWRRYNYTASGLLDSVVVSGGGISFRRRKYGYHANLRTLVSIRLNKPGAGLAGLTSIAHNNDFFPATTTFRGGGQVVQQYDTANALAIATSAAPYGSEVGKLYGYDAEGRLTLRIHSLATVGRQFTYDGLNRLTSDSNIVAPFPPPDCTPPPALKINDDGMDCIEVDWEAMSGSRFTYDAVGNRTDLSGSYTTGNRITGFAGCTYGTDIDGNVVSRTCSGQTVTFKWTAESRLDTILVGGQTIGYRYDAAGRLVRKDLGGVPQALYLWDGANLLAELSGTGTTLVAEYSYYPGLDNPHAIVYNGVEYNAHTDALGNMVALTDSTQATTRTYGSDAWGFTGGIDTSPPFNGVDRVRWKGALWMGPEVQLYYMRNRWYEPNSGRFLSEDPIGLAGGLNSFVYAADDPINGSDPLGLCFLIIRRGTRLFVGNQAYETPTTYELICLGSSRVARMIVPMSSMFRVLRNLIRNATGGMGPISASILAGANEVACRVPGDAYVGLAGNGVGVLAPLMGIQGPVGGTGVFFGSSGIGGYLRGGWGIGLDIGAMGELGFTTSLRGLNIDGSVSTPILLGGTASFDTHGRLVGGSASLGPSLLQVGGNVAVTYTLAGSMTSCK